MSFIEDLLSDKSPHEQYALGEIYYKGTNVQQDFELALKYYLKAAERGHVAAQVKVAHCYEHGLGTSISFSKAAKWHLKAANQGLVESQFRLGLLYYHGKGMTQDSNAAYTWLLKAAEKGHVYAQFYTGLCHYNGIGVLQKAEEAVQWWNKSAEHGNQFAQYFLGNAAQIGQGLPQNQRRALELFENAADQGHADAQYKLGLYFHRRINPDYNCAKRWYTKAAKQGYVNAQYELGQMKLDGIDDDVDYKEGIHLLGCAAEQGHLEAQYKLGYFFAKDDKYKDADKAFSYFKAAAHQGHADSQFELGVCFSIGIGTPKNDEEAFKWWKKAAQQKHSASEFNVGLCFEQGQGVGQDYKQAYDWYTIAANSDHTDAECKLGLCYYRGHGVDQNYEQAVANYKKAAAKDHAEAIYNLGICYKKGLGVVKDENMAIEMYNSAIDLAPVDSQIKARACLSLGRCFYGVADNARRVLAKKLFERASSLEISANYYLGLCYQNGCGCDVNEEKAFTSFKSGADGNHAASQYQVGQCYFEAKGVVWDLEEAVKWWQKAADQGNKQAQYSLGERYNDARNAYNDPKKAFEFYKKAADQGHVNALHHVGLCYYNGRGVNQDFIKAIKYFKKAAEQNQVVSIRYLGHCYADGVGVKKDESEALLWFGRAAAYNDASSQFILSEDFAKNGDLGNQEEWLTKAAEQNHTNAQYHLGLLLERVDEKDTETPKSWFTRAAELNHAEAQYLLAYRYLGGHLGYELDVEMGLKWLEKAAKNGHKNAQLRLSRHLYRANNRSEEAFKWCKKSAEQGDRHAEYYLGMHYYNEHGVAKDLKIAVQWFTESAKKGLADAQYILGVCYFNGFGVDRNYKEAAEWYGKAAEQGNVRAQTHLGDCYKYGWGVETNLMKAAELYRQASSLSDAMNKLGKCYKLGEGVHKSDGDAFRCFSSAANKNHADAEYNVGCCYRDGEGVDSDFESAFCWFSKAAEQGHTNAQNDLGNCYFHEEGVDKDFVKAVKWFSKAAKSIANSQYKLGICYDKGFGIAQNSKEAVEFYRRAANQGHANAQFNLGYCYQYGRGINQDAKEAKKYFKSAMDLGNVTASKQLNFHNLKNSDSCLIMENYVLKRSLRPSNAQTHFTSEVTDFDSGEYYTLKVFPPVSGRDWRNWTELAETKSKTINRYAREVASLRDLAEISLRTKIPSVKLEQNGALPANELLFIDPVWTRQCLLELEEENTDDVVFPAIIIEKGHSHLLKRIRHLVQDIANDDRLKAKLARITLFYTLNCIIKCVETFHCTSKVWCNCAPSNFILTGQNAFEKTVCIIDFDECVELDTPVTGGINLYLPPEYFEAYQSNEPLPAAYSLDMWSLGVTFLVLLSPLAEKLIAQATPKCEQKNVDYPELVISTLNNKAVRDEVAAVSPHLYSAITDLLHKDPEERMTMHSLKFVNFEDNTNYSDQLNRIENKVINIGGQVSNLSDSIHESVKIMVQGGAAHLPRYMFFGKSKKGFFKDDYRLHLLCDGLWALPEVGAKREEIFITTSRDHPGFKITQYKKFIRKAAPALSVALKMLGAAIKVLGAIAPSGIAGMVGSNVGDAINDMATKISDYRLLFGSAIEVMNETLGPNFEKLDEEIEKMEKEAGWKHVEDDQVETKHEDSKQEESKKEKGKQDIVGDIFVQIYDFLMDSTKDNESEDGGKWDGINHTAGLHKLAYFPDNNPNPRYVWMCRERANIALEYYGKYFRVVNLQLLESSKNE